MHDSEQIKHYRTAITRITRRAMMVGAVLVGSVCGCGGDVDSPETPEVEQSRSVSLRIVTYNAHLLPGAAAGVAGERGAAKYRAGAIAEQLVEYDLIGICEAFDRVHSQTLIDAFQAGDPDRFQVAKGPKRSGRRLVGGGLLLLSRYPIEESHTTTYKHSSRFLTSGFKADGFAAKGALHARIRIGDDPHAVIDCFLTHLESRSKRARARQIKQLAEFIELHSTPQYPIVVMGDFNVAADAPNAVEQNGNKTPYQRLRAAMAHNDRQLIDVGSMFPKSRGGTSDALAEDGGGRIDYVFVSDPQATDASRLEPKEARTLPLLDDKVPEGSLSDHLGVACRIEFLWPVATSRE
jgi:endonuclease/exonuclease/phosphatase family metal-dependent hydrolase